MIVGILGLIASGKSTVGSIIAQKEKALLFDMDFEFPEEYRERHRRGEVVPPEDVKIYQREMVERLLRKEEKNIVMAGFFLDKELPSYIEKNAEIIWINLFTDDRGVLEERIRNRKGHFAAGMEVLEDNWAARRDQIIGSIIVDCNQRLEKVVSDCIYYINKKNHSH
jgi:6-phosphogluconate dehydrogenase